LDDKQTTRPCPTCGLELDANVPVCPNDGASIDEELQIGAAFQQRYVLLERVAAGGMGVVYKAKQLGLNRAVAVKLMNANSISPQAVRRFQQEGKAMSNLHHTNLVAVHEIGVTEAGRPFLVMDYVDGITLETHMRRVKRLLPKQALSIFTQICEGLEHVHANNVLHRDLKPSNIMLMDKANLTDSTANAPLAPLLNKRTEAHTDDFFLVKLLDFGIAKLTDEGSQLTQTGEVFGSPPYMSPEQARGTSVDHRSDIYSFGCIMYEVLSGQTPFAGNSAIDTIMKQVNERQKPISALGVQIPNVMQTIIDRCMEKDPDRRYQSVSDLKNDLVKLSSWKSLLYSAAIPLFHPTQGNRALQITVAFIVVVGIGGGIIGALRLSQHQASPLGTDKTVGKQQSQIKPDDLLDDNAMPKGSELKERVAFDILRNQNMVEFNADSYLDPPTKEQIALLKDRPWKNISDLRLNAIPVDDSLGDYVQAMPLVHVELNGTHITNQFLKDIAHITSLQHLHIDDTAVTDKGITYLRDQRKLLELSLKNDDIDDEALKELSKYHILRNLSVARDAKISNAGFATFSSQPGGAGAFDLDFSDTATDDSMCKNLNSMHNLALLNLSGTKITDKGLYGIARAHAKANATLCKLVLDRTNITDAGLAAFNYGPTAVTEISLQGCPKVTESGVLKFLSKNPHCRVFYNNTWYPRSSSEAQHN